MHDRDDPIGWLSGRIHVHINPLLVTKQKSLHGTFISLASPT